jgi:pimeloyl-ACP methyl ester carboxylesterase
MKTLLNGVNISYRDVGAGLPVIFIHAFPLAQTMWDSQIDAVRNRCRAVSLDLRGFGESDAPEGPYEMDLMASDVRELMRFLGIEQAVLVGLSMGGYISMSFYKTYPEAVLAMVLSNTRAGADTPEGIQRRMASAERAEREGSRAVAKDMSAVLLAPSTIATRPDVVDRVRNMIESNSPRGIGAAQRGMARRLDFNPLLPTISCPVLVIGGSDDGLTPLSEAKTLRDGIPGARMRVIPHAGHLSNLENPADYNKALVEFISSLNKGGLEPPRVRPE